jgi:hypothetical protein
MGDASEAELAPCDVDGCQLPGKHEVYVTRHGKQVWHRNACDAHLRSVQEMAREFDARAPQ